MSFAILRHGKLKAVAKGVAASHNHRLFEEGAPNIDASRAHLNWYENDGRVVERINSKLPSKMRKDAVQVVEVVLTASPEFFDQIEQDREKLAVHPTFLAWRKATMDWAKAEFGENMVDAVLHMDEASPHFHILTVPLIEGRLCAKDHTNRKEMVRRQTSYAKAVAGFGLQRGVSAAETQRKHIPLKSTAKVDGGGKAAEQRIAELEGELARLTNRNAFLESRVQSQREQFGALMAEKEKLELELKGLKQAQKAPEAGGVDISLTQGAEDALAAFLERHKGLPAATSGQVNAGGKILDSCGRFAVISLGRGATALAEFKDQRELELAKGRQQGGQGR